MIRFCIVFVWSSLFLNLATCTATAPSQYVLRWENYKCGGDSEKAVFTINKRKCGAGTNGFRCVLDILSKAPNGATLTVVKNELIVSSDSSPYDFDAFTPYAQLPEMRAELVRIAASKHMARVEGYDVDGASADK